MRTCDISGCLDKHEGRGFCKPHYLQWWARANKEKVNAKKRERYRTDMTYRDSLVSKRRDWIKANAEAHRAAASRYYYENADERKEYASVYGITYRREHRLERNAAWHKRRMWKMAGREISGRDIRRLMQRPCLYCGESAEHMDHVIPLAKGGAHSIGNLAPACARCNLSKGSKLLIQWRIQRGELDRFRKGGE